MILHGNNASYFIPILFIEEDFLITATAALSPKSVEPGPYDSAIMGIVLKSLIA